ncbi:MAG: hypothetical protein R2750_02480 [Bacteroidales bacterium]
MLIDPCGRPGSGLYKRPPNQLDGKKWFESRTSWIPVRKTIAVFISWFLIGKNHCIRASTSWLNLLPKVSKNSMEIPRNAVFNKDRVFTVENGKLKEKTRLIF